MRFDEVDADLFEGSLRRDLPFEHLGGAFGHVGPGSTEFTVTPVPAMRLARPRATATSAVLLTP